MHETRLEEFSSYTQAHGGCGGDTAKVDLACDGSGDWNGSGGAGARRGVSRGGTVDGMSRCEGAGVGGCLSVEGRDSRANRDLCEFGPFSVMLRLLWV